MRNPDYLWSNEDRYQALNSGWVFEHYANKSVRLVWTDPGLTMHTWDSDLPAFIANQAALGQPLYERAWLYYVFLDLNGMLDKRSAKGEIIT